MSQRGKRSTSMLVTAALLAACSSGGESAPSSTSTVPASTTNGGIPMPPRPAPIAVVARTDTVEPVAGDVVAVTVYVLAEQPIASLELWDGSEKVDTVVATTPTTRLAEVLEWPATAPGVHALLVRAVDAGGRVAQAFPLWLRMADAPEPASGLRGSYGPQAASPPVGATDSECTVEVEVPSADADGIAVYAAVIGGGGFTLVDVLGPQGGTVAVPAGSGPVVVYTEAFANALGVPSAPMVSDPCPSGAWEGELDLDGAHLTADVDRAYVYVTTDGTSWNRLPSADQTFVLPGADGRFDLTDLLPAAPTGGGITVEGWGWKGGSLVALGRSTFTSTLSDGPAMSDVKPGLPILPTKGSLDWVVKTTDVSDMANPVTGEALLRSALLCTFTTTPGDLFVLPPECANSPTGTLPSSTFRWQPAPGSFTHGVWQVSVVPPPSAPVLSFPGMIATGPIPSFTGPTTDFTIPELAALLASTAPSGSGQGPVNATSPVKFEAISFETVSAIAAAAAGAGGSGQPAGGAVMVSLPPSWTGTVGSEGAEFGPVVAPLTPVQEGLYVRVVPVDGAQPQAQTSNLVEFELDHTAPPAPPPPPDPPFTLTGTIQQPTLPNTAFSHCVRVVENPFGSANPAPSGVGPWASFYPTFEQAAYKYENGVKVYKGLVPGATVCALEPSPPDDDWFDVISKAIEAVAWVWDLYADVYGMLKDKIIDGLVLATGCKSFFDESACKAMGGFVVNVAAVYVGLPPTLPKFSELMEAAKGDLKAMLIEAAVQSGVLDCGSTMQAACEKVAQEMLDELVDVIETEASKAATSQAKSGGYTLLLNPAIKVVPEPAGTMAPAVFTLTLTRTTAPSTTTACTIGGVVSGSTIWSWDADDGYHTNEKVSAILMNGAVTVDVSKMQPGQSKQVTLVVDELFDVFLPGQPSWKGSYTNPEYDPSTWIFFFPPTVLTVFASSKCAMSAKDPSAGIVSSTWPQYAGSTQPWEIP